MINNAHVPNFNDMNNALNALDDIIDNQNHNPVVVNNVVINDALHNNLHNVAVNILNGLLLNAINDPDVPQG